MSSINCADCPWRKRENSFNTHKFRDECHHPKVAFTRGVAHPEIGRGGGGGGPPPTTPTRQSIRNTRAGVRGRWL